MVGSSRIPADEFFSDEYLAGEAPEGVESDPRYWTARAVVRGDEKAIQKAWDGSSSHIIYRLEGQAIDTEGESLYPLDDTMLFDLELVRDGGFDWGGVAVQDDGDGEYLLEDVLISRKVRQ